ncbi:hypothetical protein BDW02DRAFT_569463 [Decorospora gaudefroyi]|uniref:Secreted protein n=1 Tax=Decorospora gaudefroyi TaxID=184978 RepID=A0A6A5KHX3_9PLEO|nr:hypothetical protein BDW02DRAFT_569463 [Decorospora gaudefroyi]
MQSGRGCRCCCVALRCLEFVWVMSLSDSWATTVCTIVRAQTSMFSLRTFMTGWPQARRGIRTQARLVYRCEIFQLPADYSISRSMSRDFGC